jgi:multidrug efflux pump subunit AcrA (membrane-fusion protein)
MLVPEEALVRSGQLTFVYVEGENGAERRNVRVGPAEGANVEVISGLRSGDTVIVPAA